ncbi:patj homolog, partial [Pollicipes pollicipes]
MSVLEEAERVLSALDRVGGHLKESGDPALSEEVGAHLSRLVALLENPAFGRLLKIQDSLQRLKAQLAAHPSLVPSDFDIVAETGDLELALTPASAPLAPLAPPRPPAVAPRASPGQRAASTPGAEPVQEKRLENGKEREREPQPQLESKREPELELQRDPEVELKRGSACAKEREQELKPEPELELKPELTPELTSELGQELELDQKPEPQPEPELKAERQTVVEAVSSYLVDAHHSSETLNASGRPEPPIMTGAYERELERVIAEAAKGRQVIPIQLYKQEGTSLGFSVAGLTSELNHELGIFVQGIQPDGIAASDARLKEGDQILAIDGQPLDANVSHPQAISILQRAAGPVELVVARAPDLPTGESLPSEAPAADTPQQQEMVLNTEWAQVEVIDLVNDGTGLGFGIIGGRSTGVVVKTILPGGVADRDGRLQSGDHILQIGQYNLRGMESIQVAQVLRTAGTQVRLIVARPVEPSSPDFQVDSSVITRAPIVPTRLLADPDELDHQLQALQNGFPEPYIRDSAVDENNLINGQLAAEYELREPALADPAVLDELQSQYAAAAGLSTAPGAVSGPPPPPLSDTETCEVELVKDAAGLGVTIAGYVCEREELSGIFIKSVNPGSAADLSGRIAINDQIIEVDGTPLHGYTNHQAVELLKSTGQVVRLKLARYISGPKYDQLQMAIARDGAPPASTESSSRTSSQPHQDLVSGSSASTQPVGGAPLSMELAAAAEQQPAGGAAFPGSNASYSEAIDKQVLLEDLEKLIDADYHGEIKPEVETAIQLKWGKILGDEYDIVVAQISKFQPGGGLGVSLEGTVDVEDGREVRPHHYIRSILADGPVGINGRLQSGDELLEVNGKRLLGLNHMEVVNILKELPVDVRMACARRSGHPPLHGFDVPSAHGRAQFAARSLLSGSLGQLFPSDRLVKAKSDGSLASSGATTSATDTSMSRLRSRSMEPLSGLAMWSSEPQVFTLEKGERGLGFSILDYQDPMNPTDTVIVIRSLVPGGAAQLDGRLIPGDRLMFVNDVRLENASLDQAVQALKGAPLGAVRIGVAKPLPLAADTSSSQELTASSHSETEVDLEVADVERRSSSGDSSSTDISRLQCLEGEEALLPPLPPADAPLDLTLDGVADIRQECVPVPAVRQPPGPAVLRYGGEIPPLPDELQRTVRIRKGGDELGLNVEVVDKGLNGVPVKSVTRGSAVHKDGSISAGDYIVSVNNETMRNVTQAQAKAVLRRCQLISTDITIVYVPSADAANHREAALIQIKRHAEKIRQMNLQNLPRQISPRIFPKYYRSPYFGPDPSAADATASGSDPAALTRSNTAPNLSAPLARVVDVELDAVSAFSLPQTAGDERPPPPIGRRAE